MKTPFKAKRGPREVLSEALEVRERAQIAIRPLMTPEDRAESILEIEEAKLFLANSCFVNPIPIKVQPFVIDAEE